MRWLETPIIPGLTPGARQLNERGRGGEELKISDGKFTLDIKPHGFAAVRLVP